MYAAYGFLTQPKILSAVKTKFINYVLLLIGCCGGETYGMSEHRVHPILAIMDRATRLVARV
ncbi:hypothetical protein AYI69_g2796, partial [Smittium culicis]